VSHYALVNAQLGYQTAGWSLMLWGRNLTDVHYGVRGFYFGNEPDRGWVPVAYVYATAIRASLA
jgi:iron complex outermembrane receptor protein